MAAKDAVIRRFPSVNKYLNITGQKGSQKQIRARWLFSKNLHQLGAIWNSRGSSARWIDQSRGRAKWRFRRVPPPSHQKIPPGPRDSRHKEAINLRPASKHIFAHLSTSRLPRQIHYKISPSLQLLAICTKAGQTPTLHAPVKSSRGLEVWSRHLLSSKPDLRFSSQKLSSCTKSCSRYVCLRPRKHLARLLVAPLTCCACRMKTIMRYPKASGPSSFCSSRTRPVSGAYWQI